MISHRIGRVADVPYLEGRSIAVGGRRIAVFHTAAGFVGLDNACPHEGGPLADGLLSDTCVTCPLHGWRIDLTTGEVVNGTGRVSVYRVHECMGELFLEVPAERLAEAA